MVRIKQIGMTDLRLHLRDLADEVYFKGQELVVERSGRPMLVLISQRAYDEYQRMKQEEVDRARHGELPASFAGTSK